MMQQTLHALFRGPRAADQAIDRLVALGISRDAIRTVGASTPDHVGSFADSDAHVHTPERDTVGSFASTDRGTAEASEVTRPLMTLASAAGLSPAEAAAAAQGIAAGAVFVLVQVSADQADAAARVLGQ